MTHCVRWGLVSPQGSSGGRPCTCHCGAEVEARGPGGVSGWQQSLRWAGRRCTRWVSARTRVTQSTPSEGERVTWGQCGRKLEESSWWPGSGEKG